jgi:hypothetical protein
MAAHFSLFAAGGGVIGISLYRLTDDGWIVEQSWERLPRAARRPVGSQERQGFPVYFWETEDICEFM